MLGLPPWLWGLIGIVLVIVVAVRAFYGRFRAMCRSVREDLTKYLQVHHPEAEVLREEMGNLVVRLPDGSERTWEMSEVYASVARLPNMGADPAARAPIYRQAAALLLAPAADAGPLSLAIHAGWVRPQLARPEVLDEFPPDAQVVHTPVEGLGLVALYVLDLPQAAHYVTAQDVAHLGLSAAELHRLALDNLRQNFPREMVGTALSGEGSAVQLQDSFDAARLLLVPALLEPGQEVIALLPHRDMLLLLPAELAEEPQKLEEGLREIRCADHPRLLDRPVRVTSSGFRVL